MSERQGPGRDRRGGPRERGEDQRRRDERRGRSAQRPSERVKQSDPPRLAAYTVMRAVADGAYANLELPKVLRDKRIRDRDAAFATELLYGAVRLRGRYEAIIEHAAGRPLAEIDANVLDTLVLGAHQILGMRVPAHAAVAETVGLARQVNGAGAAGFVNAVLRRVSERDLAEWEALVAPADLDVTTRLARWQSHPEWVTRAFRQALVGHGAADASTIDRELTELVTADNEAPRVSLVARPGLSSVEELVDAGAQASPTSPVGALLPGGDPAAIPAVREARAAVQDEGSQLLALALADAPLEIPSAAPGSAPRPNAAQRHERWLDLCAGPGGKAGLLAALAVQRGAELVANEVSEHRAELVEKALRPSLARAREAGTSIEVRVGDGRTIGQSEPAAFDRVLVDAPCTGLGALRRRPEARWRRTPADVGDLAALQRELLVSAIEATRPGGVVGYATCSPHLAETSLVVRDVLKRRDDVEQVDARGLFRDATGQVLPDLGAGPSVQLWPHRHGTDGMFFALLRKK